MENKCTVSSLSEYIAAIERYDLFNYISRGEKEAFESPLSSGIHRNNLQNFSKLLDAYHFNVETSITPIQDKHFLAFAQHHGMPTNLLDFSSSPLVSLYFSIDGCEDKGYVYFLKKSKTVSINKIIGEKPLGWGLLEDLLGYDLEFYKKILPNMSDTFMANREEMIAFFEDHADRFITKFRSRRSESYLASLDGGVDDFEKALTEYKVNKIRWASEERDVLTLQIYRSYSHFLDAMQKIYQHDLHYPKEFFSNYRRVLNTRIDDADRRANIDIMVFLLKMEEIEYCYNGMPDSKLEYELEFPFYFTYHPPIIDERVKNQSSVFVLQPFSTGKFFYNWKPVQVWQKIVPDFTIEIKNPNAIKKELDAIGINLKHIYCDYDSIAKYTVSSV